MRVLLRLALIVLLVGSLAAVAEASRPATGATKRAIVSAARSYTREHSAFVSVSVRHVRVSSLTASWAAAGVSHHGDGATVILRKLGGRWRGVTLGTAFGCSQAPAGVVADLAGSCIP